MVFLQSFKIEACENNLCIVTTSEVAEGITAICSGCVGQKGTQSGFFSSCNPFCTGKCYFINTIFSFSFIFQWVPFWQTFKELPDLSLLHLNSAPREYEATIPGSYSCAANINIILCCSFSCLDALLMKFFPWSACCLLRYLLADAFSCLSAQEQHAEIGGTTSVRRISGISLCVSLYYEIPRSVRVFINTVYLQLVSTETYVIHL